MRAPLRLTVLAIAIVVLSGCANHAQISREMLTLAPESMKMRQLQTKRFDTNDEKMVLNASASVLQDLGFQLDESTPDLGIIVGSKTRDATDAGQVTLAVFVALMGGGAVPIDHHQVIRVSLVTAPMVRPKNSDPTGAPQKRITPEMVSAACSRITSMVQKGLNDELRKMLAPTESSKASQMLSEQFARELNTDLTQRMKSQDFGATRVRVTFQRVVVNTQGQVTRMEPLETVDLYQTFYEKLSKSVFLEANEI